MPTLTNPHLFDPSYRRDYSDRSQKRYQAVLKVNAGMFATHRAFRTATSAEGYARRLKSRWCRLYDAAIVQAVQA